MRDPSLRFIVRVHGGWWVRIQRKAFRYSRRFMDADWGGRAKALVMAKRDRDAVEAKLPAAAHNAPALPGQGYVRRVMKHGRRAFEGFVWLDVGKSARTQNIIDVWGPRVAKRRCEEWLARHRRALGVRQVAR